MEKNNESSWARARRDTENFRKNSLLWFLGVEVVASSVISSVSAGLLAVRTDLKFVQIVLLTLAVFVVGLLLVYCLIFLAHVVLAPYRQRNTLRKVLNDKPRPQQCPNRNTLIGVMADVQESAHDYLSQLLTRNSFSKDWRTFNANGTNVDATRKKWQEKMQLLNRETLIAGVTFEVYLLKLQLLFWKEITPLETDTSWNNDVFKATELKIDTAVKDIRNAIDTISGNNVKYDISE
jgi:hypothetical protein